MHGSTKKSLVSGLVIVAITLAVPLSRSTSESSALLVSVPDRSIRQMHDADLHPSPFWTSARGMVSLYSSRAAVGNWICPRIEGRTRQPLCRRFSGQVVAACGEDDGLLIVLSDGDIHRVNYALISDDGRFVPLYHQSQYLKLVDAWLPKSTCISDARLPVIFAVSSESTLMRFDTTNWQNLD